MSQRLKSWGPLALASALALAAGYALPRQPRRGGDMLDAVAAVQRRSPRFLITPPQPEANWARSGAVYLCRTPRTADEVDGLRKHPGRDDDRWAGMVCFQGTADPNWFYLPGLHDGGDRCLHYGAFAVFGDPELLREVKADLDAAGFRPLRPRPTWADKLAKR